MAVPALFGSEFRVNTTTTGNQDSASIAALANGKFVAVWEDDGSGGINAVKGQIYNADGSKFGVEMTIYSGATNDQRPVVTGTADGRFVVAWERDYVIGTTDIFARVYNADWTSAGRPGYPAYDDLFRVNTNIINDQTEPAIAAASSGRFLVSWTAYYAGDTDIHARAYNAAAAFSPYDISVDATAGPNESQSTVAGLVNGNYVIAWTDPGSVGADTSGSHINARIYAGNGDTIPGQNEFVVNKLATGDQSEPAIAGLSDGNFVAVWTDVGSEIRYRLFQADGTALSAFDSSLLDHLGTTVNEREASVTALPFGQFVVVWTEGASASRTDGSGFHIRGIVLNNDGSPASDEFLVNKTVIAGNQSAPTVTALKDGRFVVAWTDPGIDPAQGDTSGNSVRAQIFDPRTEAVTLNGSAFGDDFVGTAFNDIMNGQAGNDRLDGAGGNDSIGGGDGTDTLFGGGGDDKLFGNDAADALSGGDGKDLLTGGADADTFHFDARAKKANIDHITDFLPGTDEIRLDISIFKKLKLGELNEKAFFAHRNADEAKDGKDRIVYDTKSGECFYDKDGKGGHHAKLFAILDGSPDDLSVADFVVVA